MSNDIRNTRPKKAVALQPEAAFQPWEDRANELLRAEMKKQKVSFKKLASLLEQFGIEESPDQINRKINRKKFTAAFLFACLAALEVQTIEIPDQLTSIRYKPEI
ncbi:hypothetical protein HA050_01835 [Iodobacter sp. HSC-16F04]|uniref:DUF6471 domain-containing protein n=1 Tax=Iodobacter violaceini TaxID=3044271 RepID=A0ABX0KQE6_9NEIS|nr:DUF6471 domain-containing protein [Iodobacter violacea]NHQ84853.1 hypothetical protein [Iodobacter violacea]